MPQAAGKLPGILGAAEEMESARLGSKTGARGGTNGMAAGLAGKKGQPIVFRNPDGTLSAGFDEFYEQKKEPESPRLNQDVFNEQLGV